MIVQRRRVTDRRGRESASRDRGAVDVSIQMLFGLMSVIFAMLLVFKAVTYWHARNVLDDAAAEGARVAAAFDGDCADGVAAAQAVVSRTAGSWADDVTVTCTDGAVVTVTVSGGTPGVLGNAMGFRARATETAPKEA
ncbi:MAG: hypothetical protein LH616_14140 [Ilumatobacteraceae bacterium]|nr:hypothetical protein [Ilumatobacteraceae bacterium]